MNFLLMATCIFLEQKSNSFKINLLNIFQNLLEVASCNFQKGVLCFGDVVFRVLFSTQKIGRGRPATLRLTFEKLVYCVCITV